MNRMIAWVTACAVAISGTIGFAGPTASATGASRAPQNVTAEVVGSGTVDVRWSPPGDTTGLVGYEVVPRLGEVNQTARAVALGVNLLTIEGLTNGSTYTFVVRAAFTDASTVSSDPSNAVVPFGEPSEPLEVRIIPGDASAEVRWNAPQNDGGSAIIDYTVTLSPGNVVQVVEHPTLTAQFNGLSNGVSYTAVVSARTLGGSATSQTSDPATPAGQPGQPVITSATGGQGFITALWTLPANTGGVDLIAVEVEVQPSTGEPFTFSLPGNASTVTVGAGGESAQLDANLSYRFRVRVTNEQDKVGDYSDYSEEVFPVAGDVDPPVLISVDPVGVIPAGAPITLVGSRLSGVTTIMFTCGATISTRTPSTRNPELLTVTAPPCTVGTDATVTATNPAGTSDPLTLKYRAVPTITAVSPATIPALGATVGISGSGFSPGEMTVQIGSQIFTGSAVTVINPSLLSVIVGSLSSATELGSAEVRVAVLDLSELQVVSASAVTFVRAANTVTLSAQTSVTFSLGLEAPFSAVADAGTLSYSVEGPCGLSAGVSPVLVTGAGTCTLTATATATELVDSGQDAVNIVVAKGVQSLTFAPSTRVTLVAPFSLSLTAGQTPQVGGGSLSFEVVSAGTTGCSVGTDGSGGAVLTATAIGTCSVRALVAETADFFSGASNPVDIVIVPAPVITSVAPAFSSAVGGTTLVVTGTAFDGSNSASTTVSLLCAGASETAAAGISSRSSTNLSVVTPACAAGTATLTVTTDDGSASTVITVLAMPSITSVTPNWSALAGGGTVTINGTGFLADHTTVRLGTGDPIAATVTGGRTSLTFVVPSSEVVDLAVNLMVAVGQVVSATSAGAFAYQSAPGVPGTVQAAAGDERATISWTAATANARNLGGYRVLQLNGEQWSQIAELDTAVLSYEVSGLVNGTSYHFSVVAYNEVGDSSQSVSVSAVPFRQAGPPTDVQALARTAQNDVPGGAIRLTWTDPADTGGFAITGYDIERVVGESTVVSSSGSSPQTVAELTNGTEYAFRVRVVTNAGPGAWSDPVAATPLDVTGAPSIVSVVAKTSENSVNGGELLVTWSAPSVTNGSAVTGYLVTATGAGGPFTCAPNPATALSCTLTGLTNGESYSVTVTATNAAGTSLPSDAVTETPQDVPGAPSIVSVEAKTIGNSVAGGSLLVTWTAATVTNGAEVSGYTVTATGVGGPFTCQPDPTTALSCALTGLTNGESYDLTVTATNATGTSDSLTAVAGTPLDVPGEPGAVSAIMDVATGDVTVSWAPAPANGSPVSYTVTASAGVPSATCTPTPATATNCSFTSDVLATIGLRPLTLSFTVGTSNTVGAGPSTTSAEVTLTTPFGGDSPASQAQPDTVVSTGTPLASGATVTIQVGGFNAFEWVSIIVESTPQLLATLQANAAGVVSGQVVMPSGLVVGSHNLTVISEPRPGGGPRVGFTQTFKVEAPAGGGGGGGGGGGVSTPAPFPAQRIGGATRYSTAVELSVASFAPGVSVVYLATGVNFADALAAGAAAGGAGPVLLTQRSSVPAETLAELSRLRPGRIVVLGGEAAISESVFEAVRPLAGQTVRLGGSDRYATAAQVSAGTFPIGVEVAYIATGTGFADALAAGAASGGRGPVLLVRPDSIPTATADELTRLRPRRIVVLGGTSAVQAQVLTALRAYTAGEVSRIGGADRYATAADLSRASFSPGVPLVFLATGLGFADALAAAALGSPVLLARPNCVPASVVAEIERLNPGAIVVLGGTAAMSDDVRRLTAC